MKKTVSLLPLYFLLLGIFLVSCSMPGAPGLEENTAPVSEQDKIHNDENQEIVNSLTSGLPSRVDNSTSKYFPPIFSQGKTGSCGHASTIGYAYTYEMSVMRNFSARDIYKDLKNRYPAGYTYNFLNAGSTGAGNVYDAINIIQQNGIPNALVYGGVNNDYKTGNYYYQYYNSNYIDYFKWMSGYDKYYQGMSNSLESYDEINVSTSQGIDRLKRWLYNHDKGSVRTPGGVATFGCNSGGWEIKPLPGNSYDAGKKIITRFGSSGGHSMTIVGYDDRVKYDYNQDGSFSSDEIGAFIIVNSYGKTWGDSGKAYLMYKLMPQVSLGKVHVITPKNHQVKTALKVKLSHSRRDRIRIYAGIAKNLNASAPEHRKFFNAFYGTGGNSRIRGKYFDNQGPIDLIEIGLDITSLLDKHKIDPSQPLKYFLEIYDTDPTNGYKGIVHSFSVMDYTSNSAGVEYVCSQRDVNLVNGTNLLSVTRGVKTYKSLRVTFDDCPSGLPAGWQNSYWHSAKWTTNQGPAIFNSTGPSGDHTTGYGRYAYVKASGNYNKTALVGTPKYSVSSLAYPEVSFWYHMKGSNMGSLECSIGYYYADGSLSVKNYTVASGNQGDLWKRFVIPAPYKKVNEIKMTFTGKVGSGLASDICIDDIEIIRAANR